MLNHVRKLYEKAVRTTKDERGQGLVEYALILVLVAIVVIAAVTNVGNSTKNVFTDVNTKLQPATTNSTSN